jgi:uncharacterized membrane protein
MRSRASIAGHPLHPLLVPIPIGLWVFSLVADVVARAGGGPLWPEMAFWAILCGLVGAVVAAPFGLADFSGYTDPVIRRLGTAHMTLNALLVVTYAANLWLRTWMPPEATLPLWLNVASIAALLISGWLGGEMVYRRGAAVVPAIELRDRPGERGRAA